MSHHPIGRANGHANASNGGVNAPKPRSGGLSSTLLSPFTLLMSSINFLIYPLRFYFASSLNHGKHVNEKKCPITGQVGERHDWQAPGPTDDRSVCPALNTLANHGYINRDGRKLSALQISYGLKACYGLSTGLALFLSFGGVFLVRFHKFLFLPLLSDINRHYDVPYFGVEHDASLVHEDTPRPQNELRSLPFDDFIKKEVIEKKKRFAPTPVQPKLVEKLMEDVKPLPYSFWYHRPTSKSKLQDATPEDTRLMSETSVARARVRREKASPPLDPMHAEIARGEMGIILGVWEQTDTKTGTKGIPLTWVMDWLVQNRLPEDWKPDHVQKLSDVVSRSKKIRLEMQRLRENPHRA